MAEDNKHYGYTKLYRSVIANRFLNDKSPFDRFHAWIYLITYACYKKTTITIRGERIELERGQLFRSITSLADEFGWGVRKTRWYISCLEKEGMITKKRKSHGMVLTIVKYGFYNDECQSDGTSHSTSHSTSNVTSDSTHNKKDNKKDNDGDKAHPFKADEQLSIRGEILE